MRSKNFTFFSHHIFFQVINVSHSRSFKKMLKEKNMLVSISGINGFTYRDSGLFYIYIYIYIYTNIKSLCIKCQIWYKNSMRKFFEIVLFRISNLTNLQRTYICIYIKIREQMWKIVNLSVSGFHFSLILYHSDSFLQPKWMCLVSNKTRLYSFCKS